MAQGLEIHLFGGAALALDGSPLGPFMSAKAPALLAYLAVTGRPHRREALAGLLWGELPDAAAANNLRQVLTSLRKSLDPFLIVTRETVELNPARAYTLDVAAFEALVAPAAGLSPDERSGRLQAAADLYGGDFLAGFYVRDAPDFEEWMLAQRARYRELALHALHTLTQGHLEAGRYDAAIGDAARLLALDPWREETYGQLMLALARTGQRSAALAQYQRCRRLLREELGVEPSAETTALYERIKAALAGPRHNLPAATTGFVGRERELAELRRLLAAADTRLLTILGPGGAGKTRLALEAARVCEPMFLNGAWLAQLSGVADPTALPWALADAVGCAVAGAISPAAQLLDFLRGRELLLVLDNFEHLIAAPALDLLRRILDQTAGVKLLVTSRVRLNLSAERLYDLAGLPCPANDTAAAAEASPAAQLFAQCARRVRPDFALSAEAASAVARLCRLTDGLPLALELAAAWTRALTPAEITAQVAAGLDSLASAAYDAPERHRSLAAVFEHSWRLLDGAGQAALAQLAVCRGGFDRAAAWAVAGVGLPVLQALTDASLLRADANGRFAMHPLAQQFAGEKLLPDGPAAAGARQRHAAYFAGLTEQHERAFHGAEDRQALRWMSQEAENIAAAWAWGVEQADPGLLEPFLESFLYFFDIQGRYEEGAAWTGQAIAALENRGECGATAARRRGLGRVLALHAAFQFRRGEFALARQRAEEALALLEPQRPQRDVGHARLYLAAAWYGLGDLARAVDGFLAAAQAYEEADHAWGVGAALDNAGYLEFLRGDHAAAAAHLTAGLAIARQTGSRYLLTGLYDHLATLAAAQGDFPAALEYVAQCQQVLGELDRPYIVASLSLSLSQIALQAGDPAAAQAHIGRAVQIARDTGNRLDLARFLLQAGAVAVGRGDAVAARLAYGEAAAVAQAIRAEGLLADAQAGLAGHSGTAS